MVSLEDEVAYAQSYIGLLNIRRDYRINISMSIEDNLMNYKILKMSLQPIIENAIKHGIDPTQADSVIRINAYRHEGFVIIEISDTGAGIDEEKLKLLNDKISSKSQSASDDGIGMKNIVERIQTHYGPEYGIVVLSKQYCFTKVMLRLPDEETSEMEYASYEKYLDSR